ncbi:MAG: SusD/RagB family nutrient-binding outer membrane lipoprotein [Phaeodactylibacter sp.]|nr:SusD/RagB family nutrient-binding outer membrane lipoprotein [Phaeodactylibacter sp.]MCB9301523.1 SusD/RagB family nutrient-binding outer membrane lipoprotein [Lewinellaceae bacterium]HQU58803.1 SusD/RagB family nutrient-binding outer membrane lipoprotein [Saprospiraceae bacterium]
MKNILNKAIIALLIFAFTACGDFEDLNVNPNKPVSVDTETLLTSAMREVGERVLSNTRIGPIYAQHIGNITYTDDDRYQAVQSDFSGWYTGPLADLERIIELNTDVATKDAASKSGSNANQIAAARILKAYFFNILTDLWGPMPYSEALKGGEGLLTPAYDSQSAIYEALFTELQDAVAQMDGGAGVSGDFIFGGDMAEWAKFANTIRMNMAIRAADANETLAKAQYLDAIADGVIDADLMYPFLPEANNENPWFSEFRTRTDFAITEMMVNDMSSTADPRLAHYADPTGNSVAAGNPVIVGVPYGLSTPSTQPPNVSFPNSTFVKAQDAPLAIFTLAQVNFAKAEAAARGWTNDNAEDLYKAGIKASWDQWSVSYDNAAFDSYYNQAAIQWNSAKWDELIGYQKWVALFGQGFEAWTEWRRLDYPALIIPEDPLSPSGGIPLRLIYPTNEANLNGANYETAVGLLGGPDSDGTRLWWDTK